MKNKIIFFVIFCFLFYSFLYSEELGDKVYKEVNIDGEIFYKWLEYTKYEKFDINGNLVYTKELDSDEVFYKYDNNGNKIYEKYGDHEDTYQYDKNNKLIHEKTSSYEWWYEYDKYGTIIHEWTSDGYESKTVCKYDKNGKLIYSKSNVKPIGSPERIDEWWYEYNADGTIEHGICKDISEYYIHYNKNGNIIYHKSKAWYEDEWDELWFEFDANGNKVFEKGKYGECHYKYDERNNLIYAKWINDLESWYEYEYYNDGTKKTCKKYTTFLGLDD